MHVEEQQWREQEEKIKEVTYDAERRQGDASIQTEEGELAALRAFPLRKLAEAGIMASEKEGELAAAGVVSVGGLVQWLGRRQ